MEPEIGEDGTDWVAMNDLCRPKRRLTPAGRHKWFNDHITKKPIPAR
ncbi:hypothetical protein HUG20_03965 [Salicibibacter cibi]|uniref:Uncharacterized protein n=1 Tax=Salicibibacter cibi TaxID=2743001 RepID=A0A7T6Z8Z9_9BACI|nr:hypothetical protein [Salicibibacter cibi]QQK79141.1 hypothetical protein HUG20_03965 [Salicibibacter cibi]